MLAEKGSHFPTAGPLVPEPTEGQGNMTSLSHSLSRGGGGSEISNIGPNSVAKKYEVFLGRFLERGSS